MSKAKSASHDRSSRSEVAKRLIADHGRTYCEEIGINIARNTPSMLFRWLVASILFSARIRADAAVSAARALSRHRWNTPRAMCDAGWEARVRVLNHNGYARYDESTSRELGDSCRMLIDDYRGDLRRLRDKAGGDAKRIPRLLQAFKGIGPMGAEIFCREVQLAWDELYPFVDRRALKVARAIGLADDGDALAGLVSKSRFSELLAALVRVDLEKSAGDYRL